jgi:hypothetical protein
MALCLLAAFGAADAACAAPRALHRLPHVAGVAGGSDRYAVLARDDGSFLVRDDAAGTVRPLTVPAACSDPQVHGRRVVLTCLDPGAGFANSSPYAVNLRTLLPIPIAGVDVVDAWWARTTMPTQTYWGPMGGTVLAFAWAFAHGAVHGTINWRTGRLVVPPPVPRRRRARTVGDVDSATGQASVCAPLSRLRDPEWVSTDGSDRYLPAVYRKPWVLQVDRRHDLVLLHCGRSRPVRRLAACPFGLVNCGHALGRGLVAWADEATRRLHVLRLGDGRERTWRLPGRRFVVDTVALTTSRVYVATRGVAAVFSGPVPPPEHQDLPG